MSNCSFCGAAIEPATGKMYIKKDGTVLRFESAKCQRNMVGLGRINRYVGWTEAAKAGKNPVAPKVKAVPKGATKATKRAAAAKAAAK